MVGAAETGVGGAGDSLILIDVAGVLRLHFPAPQYPPITETNAAIMTIAAINNQNEVPRFEGHGS